ncbi:hypothetical protein [Psychroserpens algicola]|uniref:hypothetical protein n=1 Tax=Psychroserpens algicola TaxID=1719034 RepID=UPI001952EB53|nr:hypothetical protein [Psychroserpens algicola]
MIKFFRNIRQNLLSEGKTGKYFKYAIGEIILVVIGILIALQINNWNEKRKENIVEVELIDVLITDLKSKKTEFLSDLAIGKLIIKNSDISINHWENTSEIDTLNLKFLLKFLGEDEWFFEVNSPIYSTISGSGLWKQLPDSLNKQIDEIYRGQFGRIKSAFVKQSEYALNTKLTFLTTNRLLTLDKSTSEIQQIVSEKDEEFIKQIELFKSGVIRLTSNFKTTIPAIEKLIENLEYYKKNK